MLPADLPFTSLRRTSVSELQIADSPKKKEAASSAIILPPGNELGR